MFLQSAVTHVSSEAKWSVLVTWQADSGYEGRVRILATVVKEYDTYWTKIPSPEIEIRHVLVGEGRLFKSVG